MKEFEIERLKEQIGRWKGRDGEEERRRGGGRGRKDGKWRREELMLAYCNPFGNPRYR